MLSTGAYACWCQTVAAEVQMQLLMLCADLQCMHAEAVMRRVRSAAGSKGDQHAPAYRPGVDTA